MPVTSPPFQLEDHLGRNHSFDFPRPLPTVLCFGDMVSAFQLESWIEPLYSTFRERIDIIGIAAFRGVPGVFRDLVKLSIREVSPKEVLIDWDGNVASEFGIRFGQCRVVAIDYDGNVTAEADGPADPRKFESIISALETALASRPIE
jgi:hypothetical protein